MESNQLSSLGSSKFSREKRSIILKNRILKYDPSASSSSTDEFFSMLKDNFQSMDNKAIQSVRKVQKRKKVVDQSNRKNDWIEEQKYLWNQVIKLEQDISSFIQNSISYQDSIVLGNSDNDLSKDLLNSFSHTNDYKSTISQKLKELKSLLKQRSKSKTRRKSKPSSSSSLSSLQSLKNDAENGHDNTNNSDDKTDEGYESMKAELLLATRRQWITEFESFIEQETLLQSEVDAFQVLILSMLQHDKIQTKIQQKENRLKLLDTDGFTIQMYMTEWNHRYDLLLQLFTTECDVIDAEYNVNTIQLYQQFINRTNVITSYNVDGIFANTIVGGSCGCSKQNNNNSNHNESISKDVSVIVESITSSAATSSSIALVDFKKTGGWSVTDHEAFVKINKESTRKGMTRVQLREKYATYLPTKQSADIDIHENWYRNYKIYKNKLKVAQSAHDVKIQLLIQEGVNQLQILRQEQQIILLQQQEQQIFDSFRNELHEKLNELSAQKQLQSTAQTEKLLLQQQLQDSIQQQLLKKSQIEREHQKQQIAEYNIQKQQETQLQLLEQNRLQEQQEQLRKMEIDMNKTKVEQRRELQSEKEEEKRQKKEQSNQLEIQRMEKLMKIASQVPYYDIIQTIESKLTHTTAAVEHHKYIPYNPNPNPNPNSSNSTGNSDGEKNSNNTTTIIGRNAMNNALGVFQPLRGYDDKKIVSDVRFKLATALRAAGVQSSEPARLAIQQFHVRPHLAIHGIL